MNCFESCFKSETNNSSKKTQSDFVTQCWITLQK